MTKNFLIKKFFDHKKELAPPNPLYQKELERIGIQAIAHDMYPQGDLTTKSLFKKQIISASAEIISKEAGILAGISEIQWIIKRYCQTSSQYKSPLSSKILAKDGDYLSKGEKILHLQGNLADILIIERTILNILQRLSGIATQTQKLISIVRQKNPHINVAATRKTPLGLLDKKAVSIGGGLTHRLNLSSGILIKDTHLDFLKRDLNKVFSRIFSASNQSQIIEIEVKNPSEALLAATLFQKYHRFGIIMLDNFSIFEIKKTLSHFKKSRLHKHVIIEVSGNITPQNIHKYCLIGIDVISLGFLTHSPSALDFSLKINNP